MSAAARGLRASVERAGGTMRISETALGDTFGRGRMTPRARAALTAALGRAGLVAEPALTEPGGDGWVTLRLADAPAERATTGVAVPGTPVRTAGALAADRPGAARDAVRAPAAAAAAGAPPGMLAGAVAAGALGTVAGLASAPLVGLLLALVALGVTAVVRARGHALGRDLAPRVPGALRAPAVLGALAFAAPAVLVVAVASSVGGPGSRPADPPAATTTAAPDPRRRLLDRSEAAFRAGDFRSAVRLAQQADPAAVPPLRARIARRLVEQARAANERGDHEGALRLARRAERAGPAPGAGAVARAARAALGR